MIKTNLYNQEGKVLGEVDLPEEVFGLKPNTALMQEAVVAQMAGSRVKYAHVKTRGEVRGGGKKPWAQKHTGQARHGSIRSPLWRKGGVVFGPTPEASYEKKINLKKRRLALFMALASKLKDKNLFILDDLKIASPKTKEMVRVLENLGLGISKPESDKPGVRQTALISLPGKDKNVYLASRNIAGIKTILTNSLNIVDLLSYKCLVMPKAAVGIVTKTFKI